MRYLRRTDLTISMPGEMCAATGATPRSRHDDTLARRPGARLPAANSVKGTLCWPGDVTHLSVLSSRYAGVEKTTSRARGRGVDAELMRRYIAAWATARVTRPLGYGRTRRRGTHGAYDKRDSTQSCRALPATSLSTAQTRRGPAHGRPLRPAARHGTVQLDGRRWSKRNLDRMTAVPPSAHPAAPHLLMLHGIGGATSRSRRGRGARLRVTQRRMGMRLWPSAPSEPTP